MTLAYNYIGTYRAGSVAYQQHMRDRFNGKSQVRVEFDSSVYVYDNSRENRAKASEWRAFILSAFVDPADYGSRRLTGSFPFYTVECVG